MIYKNTLNLVGQRWSLKPGTGWNQNKPENRLVVIGVHGQFDPEALDALWQACTNFMKDEV